MLSVREACCKFLMRQLHPTNCLGIKSFADAHSCKELLKQSQRFALHHFQDVVSTEEFMLLPFNEVNFLYRIESKEYDNNLIHVFFFSDKRSHIEYSAEYNIRRKSFFSRFKLGTTRFEFKRKIYIGTHETRSTSFDVKKFSFITRRFRNFNSRKF